MQEMFLVKAFGSPTVSPSELESFNGLANRFTRAERLEAFRRMLKGVPKSITESGEWHRAVIRMTEGGYKIVTQYALPVPPDQSMDVTGEILILGIALDECEGIPTGS